METRGGTGGGEGVDDGEGQSIVVEKDVNIG